MKSFVRSVVERLLRWSAQRTIAASKPIIVGVGGSSGKTSTKEAIVHVLKATVKKPVRGSEGNLNTEFGLPMAILNIPKPETAGEWLGTVWLAIRRGMQPPAEPAGVLVLEYGEEYPGDIATLVAIAQPTVSVITNVGPAHLEFLKTLDNVAKELVGLVVKVPATGLVVLCADDQFADWMAEQTRAEVKRFHGAGAEFTTQVAVAVAEWFDVPAEVAKEAVQTWTPPPGRLVALDGVNDSKLLDDSYNGNPSSTTLALNTARKLAKQAKAPRLIAVLGDMLELGDDEQRFHRGIALLSQKVADVTILVGRRFKDMPSDHWVASPMEAAELLKPMVSPGDMILIKGSQGMRMEKVVEALLKNPADSSRLVRQSPAWKAKPFIEG